MQTDIPCMTCGNVLSVEKKREAKMCPLLTRGVTDAEQEWTVMSMKVENGKIVEATEDELFGLYLDRGMDDVMDFHEYENRMQKAGCVVKDGG